MSILDATATALKDTLTGGTALTALLSTVPSTAGTVFAVYDTNAVDGATYDYVVYSLQAGGPDLITSKDMESNVWFVRGYSSTGIKAATAIFNQFDALLNEKNISITGFTTFWCAREENTRLVETQPNGKKAYSVGGMYRIDTTLY